MNRNASNTVKYILQIDFVYTYNLSPVQIYKTCDDIQIIYRIRVNCQHSKFNMSSKFLEINEFISIHIFKVKLRCIFALKPLQNAWNIVYPIFLHRFSHFVYLHKEFHSSKLSRDQRAT